MIVILIMIIMIIMITIIYDSNDDNDTNNNDDKTAGSAQTWPFSGQGTEIARDDIRLTIGRNTLKDHVCVMRYIT